jgi:hypothetical protein
MRTGFLLLLLCISAALYSQEFGGNPPSLKWKQVNSPIVRVIFPEGLDKQAVRIADISRFLHAGTANTIGTQTRKIDIVLQNQTTFSNGYVGLAPWRSEFYLTPMQNSLRLGSLNWADQLAIHEYRHVQQYMNFRKGLSKFAFFLAGEEGLVLANNAAVPNWFFEGDAVLQETIVTGQGRGRLPSFFSEYRALWDADRDYSYMKLRNGSMKDLVPDHYIMGYMLVTYGRDKYGDEFWKKVTDNATRYKPFFYPFQGAVKKHAGVPFKEFVKATYDQFRTDPAYNKGDSATPISKTSDRYVKDYAFPYVIGRDSILVYRRTGSDIPGFYLIHNGKEKRIAVKDLSIDEQYSYRNGKIAYTTYDPDVRWGWRNYSEIVLLDVNTGARKSLTNKSKYFSPDISHNSKRLAVVDVQPNGSCSIHVLDAGSGDVEKVISDSGYFYAQPRFSKNDEFLFCPVRSRDGKMSMLKIDIDKGESTVLFPFSFRALAFPFVRGDSVLFTATKDGQDQLLVWDDGTRELKELLSRYAGIQQAVPYKQDSVLFTGTSAWGNRLYKAAITAELISSGNWVAEDMDLYKADLLKKDTSLLIDNATSGNYDVNEYKSTSKFFNFHSWRPYYEQPEWSLSFYGNNIMNTFSSSLYFIYNENEGYQQLGFNGTYAAWFPWITGGVSYTFDREANVDSTLANWNELNANIGLRVPFNFSGGRSYKFLSIQTLFNTEQVYFKGLPKESNFGFNYLDNGVNWNFQVQQALQHIYPRFAHTINVRYRASVSDIEARQLLATTAVYLPGLFRNHSLVLSGAYQSRDTARQYLFSNSFPLSRGYPDANFPRMWKWSVNYHMPVVYPDWGFAQLVYFMRVRANLFYDQSYLKSLRTGVTTGLASAGMEIFFDTKWWNQQPISFGFRYSRLLDTDVYASPPNANQFEFVLPVNLIPR